MWYLISEKDKRVIYVLPDKNVVIGRYLDGQNCNFAISEDASISRKHAILLISDNALFLKDLGSKYGTFINDLDKVDHNVMVKLNNNDVVKFGKLGCTWKVQQVHFVTCTSTLKGDHLQILKNFLTTLNGTLKNEWDDTCVYLTMPAITLTIKVVLALVQNSRIVTIDYWKSCVEAISNNLPLPNTTNFVPQILESTLNKENVSFDPKMERTTLFAGKKVIFLSRKQLEMYKTVLAKSSATPLLLSESKLTKTALCEDDVIVIQFNLTTTSQETQAQKDKINEIIECLKSKGKRIVADAEIGLAILYCSISKYCNPAFNLAIEVVKQVPNQNDNPKNVLVLESQEPSETSKKENMLVDESLTQKNSSINEISHNSSKRKLSDDDANCMNKKPAIEPSNVTAGSKKRQGEFSDLDNPSKKIAVDNDDQGMFNFIDNVSNANQKNCKKLNLLKPTKRKLNVDTEDDLFNFVDNSNKKIAVDKSKNILETQDSEEITNARTNVSQNIDEKIDLNILRGSKLEELMKSNMSVMCNNIKKEDTTDLDEKFSKIDLGSTSIVVRNDLIIKKEAIVVQIPEIGIKNFKKFKKVWPIKLHVNIVPKITKSMDSLHSDLDNRGTVLVQ